MNSPWHQWENVEEKTVIPGYHGRFVHSKNMTFALWRVDAGSPVPEHSHPHEQMTEVLEGELEFTIDGKTQIMKAGSIAIIPPHAVHSGRAITNCRLFDVFYPLREDYLGTSEAILQKAAKA